MKSVLPGGGLEFHNTTPVTTATVPTISGKNKSPQKLFHWQTILLHHVTHYHSMAFQC